MKARLLSHLNVGMLNIVGDYGHIIPDEEVEVLCGPFISTIANSPMLAWCLCESKDGRKYYIEATNLQNLELPLEDSTKDVGKIFSIPVDWDAFRREAAKDLLVAMTRKVIDDSDTLDSFEPDYFSKIAVEWADSLVKHLKMEDEK